MPTATRLMCDDVAGVSKLPLGYDYWKRGITTRSKVAAGVRLTTSRGVARPSVMMGPVSWPQSRGQSCKNSIQYTVVSSFIDSGAGIVLGQTKTPMQGVKKCEAKKNLRLKALISTKACHTKIGPPQKWSPRTDICEKNGPPDQFWQPKSVSPD